MEAHQHTPLWRTTHSNASQRNPSAFWLETDHSFPLQLSLGLWFHRCQALGMLGKDVERMSSFHDMCCPDHQKPRVKPQRICVDTCHHPQPLLGSPASYIQHTWLLHNSIHSQEFGHPHAKGQWSELVHGGAPHCSPSNRDLLPSEISRRQNSCCGPEGKMLPAGKQTQFGEMRRDRFSVTLTGQSCGCFNPIIWTTGSAYPGRKAPLKGIFHY